MRQTQPLAQRSVPRSGIKFFVVLVVASWTAGCIPMRYTSGPGAKGRVVDANSHAPVADAFVTMTRSKGAAAQTTTAKDGKFRIGSRHRWYLLNLFHASTSKPVLQPAVLTITGGSYLTFATNTSPGTTLVDVGEVQLQPLPK